MSKALLIKSYTALTIGTQGQWNDLNMATSYIQGIQTGEILENNTADKIAALISGVPTPWARAKLFKFAFDTLANPDPNINNSGLLQFYTILLAEWKGIIALMALYPDRIRFSAPVIMNVMGDDYSIASAFGRMLFNDKDIWSNQDELSSNPDAQPYIHLIYYKSHLIGGTSPLTGVFTGVSYDNLGNDANDISWYRNGKFDDPLPHMSPQEVQKLYLFVKNINGNLDNFDAKVNSLRQTNKVNLNGFKNMCRKWEDEIKNSAQGLREKGPVSKFENLSCPFSILFKSDVPVYMKPDYTFTYNNGIDCQIVGDIQSLLSSGKCVIGWTEGKDKRIKRSNAPVYFLQVEDIRGKATHYFTLPLSEKGIDIFKNRLAELLGYNNGGNSSLSASINTKGDTLSVAMTVEIDGEHVTLNTREYEIDWMESLGHVILWPNFVSDNWNKYYLYSEFISGSKELFLPIFRSDGEILRDGKGNFLTPEYKYQPGEKEQVVIKKLITYPAGQGDALPKYNILGADKPIDGLLVKVMKGAIEECAGYLMLRHNVIEDFTSVGKNSDVTVGIDFGSNNTCVYYNADNRGAKPVEFENNRAVLVGEENIDERANASNDELLFFTNYPAKNGQLKSWLHEHDSRYNKHNQSEEVAGGVPVNRPNVVVKKMDEYYITTQAGVLHYNMKWLDDDKGKQKKGAFLKSIWLQTCAFLYKNKFYPTEIRWSHPGSMMESDINEYERIFDSLAKMGPIIGNKTNLSNELPTEAEAVCSFALSQDFGVTSTNMFLGIDVGGSTSDIMLLAKDSKNNKTSLFRESSVRLAAGVFFNAVIDSLSFRKALVDFHEGSQRTVYVSNIKDVLTESNKAKAPYYLNNIFDQLKASEDYDKFYEAINANAKFVFTIPAYVTGLLLYYSGMLVGKVIKDNKLTSITNVDILSFGKGGRIFHWLRSSVGPRPTREYYATCLNAGAKVIVPNIALDVKYRDEIEVDNKAEVAKGLCDPQNVERIQDNVDSDICGEVGVKYITPDGSIELSAEDELKGENFDNNMDNFDFSSIGNFKKFMEIFIEFVSRKTQLYPKAGGELIGELNDLPNRIASYIRKNDPEYRKAKSSAEKRGDGFHYHQPIIIAEGVCFLNTLIRKAFNQ